MNVGHLNNFFSSYIYENGEGAFSLTVAACLWKYASVRLYIDTVLLMMTMLTYISIIFIMLDNGPKRGVTIGITQSLTTGHIYHMHFALILDLIF